jgi:hypothetical protein
MMTGFAPMTSELGFERRHSTWDDRGEIVWNVREL